MTHIRRNPVHIRDHPLIMMGGKNRRQKQASAARHFLLLSGMPTTLSMPLPFLLLVLSMVEPGSGVFLLMLEAFLRSKEGHKLLAQLRGPDAVYVADALDKVRKRATVSHEVQADFRIAYRCAF